MEQYTGNIDLTKKIDRETMGSSGNLQLTVVAEDGGKPPRNSTALIQITINDINDNAPEFCDDDQTLEFTFNESDTTKAFYTAKVISKIFFRIEINIFMCIKLLNILRPIYNEHCVKLMFTLSLHLLLQATDKDADDHNGILFDLVNETSSFSINKGVLSVKSPLNKTDAGVLIIVTYNNRSYSNKLSNKTQKISVKVQVCNLDISECNFEHCTFYSKFRYLSQRVQLIHRSLYI